MGYGEYDGGGSVKWHVEHDNGDYVASAHPKSGKGRDEVGDRMRVWVRDTPKDAWRQVADVECARRPKVVIVWGSHYPGPPQYDMKS